MGYTFTIGNAIPVHDKTDFPYLTASWEVKPVCDALAPTFINDTMTGNGNFRSSSYSVWSNFCHATGLYEFFFTPDGHLHAGHPGCFGITAKDAKTVTKALNRYQHTAVLPPGFEEMGYDGPPNYDYHLARLIWLEWWMRWAVEHCETPAIQNT